MIIAGNQVSEEPKRFVGEEQFSVLESEREFIKSASVIGYDLSVQSVSDELIVRGSLKVDLRCFCARCAESFAHTIRVTSFLRSFPLTPENESVDLTNDIREDILLAFPMNWVCSVGCKGLCPECGANLNRRECRCDRKPKDMIWNALDQLSDGADQARQR